MNFVSEADGVMEESVITENVRARHRKKLDKDDFVSSQSITIQGLENEHTSDYPGWSGEAVKKLIDLYTEHVGYFTNPDIKKKNVWGLITRMLSDSGFNYTVKQAEQKWRNIKRQYRKTIERRNEGKKVHCPYFNELDKIFSSIISSPLHINESSSSAPPVICEVNDTDLLSSDVEIKQEADLEVEVDESIPGHMSPPRKSRRIETEWAGVGDMIDIIDDKLEELKYNQQRHHEETMLMLKQILDAVRPIGEFFQYMKNFGK